MELYLFEIELELEHVFQLRVYQGAKRTPGLAWAYLCDPLESSTELDYPKLLMARLTARKCISQRCMLELEMRFNRFVALGCISCRHERSQGQFGMLLAGFCGLGMRLALICDSVQSVWQQLREPWS